MIYENPKKVAEDLERRAKILAQQTYLKERYSHLSHEELDKWRKKTFDRHKEAGAMYIRAKKPKKAIGMYQGAIKFAPSEKIEERIREQIRGLYGRDGKRLERTLFSAASIISLLGALFFMSFNLTGNSIGNLSNENLSLYWAGIGLFILGLVFAFMFFKNKKK